MFSCCQGCNPLNVLNLNSSRDCSARVISEPDLVQVAFLAGVMYTIVGIFNLGFITNFISHTVISGFMSGAAVIIGLSQVSPYTLFMIFCSTSASNKILACLGKSSKCCN